MPKISQYPPMTALTGSELFIGDQAGITATGTAAQLSALAQGGFQFTDTGVVNAYVLTSAKTLQALNPGQLVSFTPLHPNTGASTLNAAGSGVVALLDGQGNPLTGGEITGPTVAMWTGSQWEIIWQLPLANKRSVAEIAALVTPTNYSYLPLDIRRYGGDPTGATSSDAAMTAAIAVATAGGGGVIRLPGGLGSGGAVSNYKFASSILLNTKTAIILQGDGAATAGANPSTVLTFTGTGSGVFINMNSSVGVQLRGMQILHSSASFTGTYISCNNDGTHGDPSFCGVFDCVMGTNISAVTHINLNKCLEFTAERCNFNSGSPSIQLMTAGNYSNVINFYKCQWLSSLTVPVQGGGQAVGFYGCTWEALANGNAGAILSTSSSTPFAGLTLQNCWIGDESISSSAATWIDVFCAGATFTGNYISGSGGSSNATAIVLRQASAIMIAGNEFAGLSKALNFAAANCLSIVVVANVTNTVATFWTGTTNIPVGELLWQVGFGVGSPPGHFQSGANGFTTHPDGTIEQWGTAVVTIATGLPVLFATAGVNFPNSCFQVQCSFGSFPGTNTVGATSITTNGFTISSAGTAGSATVYWRAWGN